MSKDAIQEISGASSEVQLYTSFEVIGAKEVVYKDLIVVNIVKSRNVISNMGANLKSIVGGNIGGLTKLTTSARKHLIEEITKKAQEIGANALIGLRFETCELFEGMTELLLYGTAVHYTK